MCVCVCVCVCHSYVMDVLVCEVGRVPDGYVGLRPYLMGGTCRLLAPHHPPLSPADYLAPCAAAWAPSRP